MHIIAAEIACLRVFIPAMAAFSYKFSIAERYLGHLSNFYHNTYNKNAITAHPLG